MMAAGGASPGLAHAQIQAAMEHTRPWIYPLSSVAELADTLKVGDVFKSKDHCKAVVGALAISHNTPCGPFKPNRPDKLGARCICGVSCGWGIQFNAILGLTARVWKVTQYNPEHTGTGCASATFVSHPYNPPYNHFLLAHTLLGTVAPGKKTANSTVQSILANYLPYAVSQPILSNIKACAEKLLLSTAYMPAQVSPTLTAGYQNALLLNYTAKLRENGHIVSLTTQRGVTLRAFIVDAAKKAFLERQKSTRKAVPKQAFDSTYVLDDPFYQSIDPNADHVYTIMVSPSPARHLLSTCRRISQSDFAFCKGSIAGNFFNRTANDANHGVCHLVVGYVVGNENSDTWTIANEFTKEALPAYDERGQVDITDGSKGAKEATSVWENVLPFQCSNHRMENAKNHGGKLARLQYQQAVHATTYIELQALIAAFGDRLKHFVDAHSLESQFPAALLQKHNIFLHGTTTSNSSESVNHQALVARSCNSEFHLLETMVQMCYTNFYKHSQQMTNHMTNPSRSCPPAVFQELRKLHNRAQQEHSTASIRHLGNGVYCMLGDHLAAGNIHVNLKAPSLSNMCCAWAHLQQKPCIHIVSCLAHSKYDTFNFPDIKILHPSNTIEAWKAQYDTIEMTLPSNTGNIVDYMALQSANPTVSLTASSAPVTVLFAPVVPNPPGRPTKARQAAYKNPKKPRKCSKCGLIVVGHDARTCKGRSQVPASITGVHVSAAQPLVATTMTPFTYETQKLQWCLKHAINNLFAAECVTEQALKDAYIERGEPLFSNSNAGIGTTKECGDSTGYSCGTAVHILTKAGFTCKERLHGLSLGLVDGEDWAPVIGKIGALLCAGHHFTCITTLRLYPKPLWRHINSFPLVAYKDFDSAYELGKFIDTKMSNDRAAWSVIQLIKPPRTTIHIATGIHSNCMRTFEEEEEEENDGNNEGEDQDEEDDEDDERPTKRAKAADDETETQLTAKWAQYVTAAAHAQGRATRQIAKYVKPNCIELHKKILGVEGMRTVMSPTQKIAKVALLQACKYQGTEAEVKLVKACFSAVLAEA
jgi:hypothetical protein